MRPLRRLANSSERLCRVQDVRCLLNSCQKTWQDSQFFFSSHRPHEVHAWHREFATAWPESAWSCCPATYFFFFFFWKQNPLKMDLRLLSMKSDLGWPGVSRSVWRHISHCHCGPLWLALWFYLGINNCCRQADWWSVCVCRGVGRASSDHSGAREQSFANDSKIRCALRLNS